MPATLRRRSGSPLLPKEVGERLRLLRVQAGLSQEAVAAVMELRGSGGRSHVCQVERGYLKSGPGFVRMLDCLRACGRGVDSLLDILGRHTARETVREEQAAQAVRAAIADVPDKLRTRALYYDIRVKHSTR